MGIFHTKKIKLNKIISTDSNVYFIDFYKLPKPDVYLEEFIPEIMKTNSLLLIDMEKFYSKSYTVKVDKIIKIKNILDETGLQYEEIIEKKEEDVKFLEFKIQASKKVDYYKLGVSLSPNKITDVLPILKDCNSFIFSSSEEISTDQLILQFQNARGDFESLDQECDFSIFIDSELKRLRIKGKDNLDQIIEDKLQRYN